MIANLRLAEFRLRQIQARSPWLPWALPLLIVGAYMAARATLRAYSATTGGDALMHVVGCRAPTLALVCATGAALMLPLYRCVSLGLAVLACAHLYVGVVVHYVLACVLLVLPGPIGVLCGVANVGLLLHMGQVLLEGGDDARHRTWRLCHHTAPLVLGPQLALLLVLTV